MEKHIKVSGSDDGLRIDQFLSNDLKISRSRVKKYIDEGKIFLNSTSTKTNRKIKLGDVISYNLNFDDENQKYDKPEKLELEILYEDEFLMAINKQPHIIVHPGAGNFNGTIMNGLLGYNEDLNSVDRAGIVHRLDKDTSGVLVVAKNNYIKEKLQEQFKSRVVKKMYTAIVFGNLEKEIFIENFIGRHPIHRKKQTVLKSGGRKAISLVSVEKVFENTTQVNIDIRTGRTHQIRVHLAHIGYPIIGDKLYGNKKSTAKIFDVKRHMLHACSLEIIHPKNEKKLIFQAPLAKDMNYFLKGLN